MTPIQVLFLSFKGDSVFQTGFFIQTTYTKHLKKELQQITGEVTNMHLTISEGAGTR